MIAVTSHRKPTQALWFDPTSGTLTERDNDDGGPARGHSQQLGEGPIVLYVDGGELFLWARGSRHRITDAVRTDFERDGSDKILRLIQGDDQMTEIRYADPLDDVDYARTMGAVSEESMDLGLYVHETLSSPGGGARFLKAMASAAR